MQDESWASYQSFPEQKDYALSRDWTARGLYNFICAMQKRAAYFPYIHNGHRYLLTEAYSFQTGRIKALKTEGQQMTLPCNDGSVEVGILL